MKKIYLLCLLLAPVFTTVFANTKSDVNSIESILQQQPPLQILNWDVLIVSKQVHTTWKISNDVNVVKYEVEKSLTGVEFTLLKPVSPVRQAYTTTYGVIDRMPSKGWNYYRVKITDDKGKVTYTSVKKILYKEETNWTFNSHAIGSFI